MSRFTTSGADFSMPYAPARRDGARYQPLDALRSRSWGETILVAVCWLAFIAALFLFMLVTP